MKKFFLALFLTILGFGFASAQQKDAQIKFEKTTYDFGKFSTEDPIQKCVFTFTNVGEKPLVINQAVASCGCTIPTYTKTPIQPGEKGEVKVTYNGRGAFAGRFKKTITIRTNGVTEVTRLHIEGEIVEGQP